MLSGAVIREKNTLSASGNLVVEGSTSGASLYIATSINGAGLTACTASSQYLQCNISTCRFTCTNAHTFGSGNVLAIGNARYISKAGGTMTGALTVSVT